MATAERYRSYTLTVQPSAKAARRVTIARGATHIGYAPSVPIARALLDVLAGEVATVAQNPSALALFLANPRPGEQMSRHVQLLAYKHIDDGEFYAHPFGGREQMAFVEYRGRQALLMDSLPATTDVEMWALGSGDILLHHTKGKPLAREF